MVPRRTRGAGSAADYDSEAKKMLATKNDLTIAALIRGIRDPERAQAFIDAELEVAADDDRDVRTGIIGACNRKKMALQGRKTGATPIECETSDHTDADEDADTPATNGQSDESSGEADPDDGDPYPDAPRFDDTDALQAAVVDHEHGDVFTTAKYDGTVAGCFKCESHIGFVPADRGGGPDTS